MTTRRRTLEKLPEEAMATSVGGKMAARQRTGRHDAVNCKKHPKHRQPPGVCAVCLSKRLAQLAAKKEKKGFISVFLTVGRKRRDEEDDDDDDSLSSSPSSVSSSSGSSCSSPMDDKYVISREGKGSSSSASWSSNFFMNGKSVLTKSRSLASVPRNDNINGDGDHGKRPTGFWSKLTLRNSSRHSKKLEHI